MPYYSNELIKFGYLAQTVFGTAQGDAAAYKEIKCPKGIFVNPSVSHEDLDLNRASRIQDIRDVYVDGTSGPVLLTIPEMICSRARVADFLYAAMENRINQDTGPNNFQKQFKMHASQPDFISNAGYFFTLAQKSPQQQNSIKVTDCVIKSLDIDIDRSGIGMRRLVRFRNVNVLGRIHAANANFSGVWVDTDTNYYKAESFTISENIVPQTHGSWLGATVSIDNGAEPLDVASTGNARTWFLNPPKMGAVRATFRMFFTAEETYLMASYRAGTQHSFQIVRGTPLALDYWSIKLGGIVQENPQGTEERKIITPVTLVCGDSGAGQNPDAVVIDFADNILQ